jgi:hypothetical protein
MSSGGQNMKTGPDALGNVENESERAQNMKRGPDALGTAENEFGRTKHENGTRRPWYPDAVGTAKMIPGAQNMKTGPDALGTAQK